MTDETKKRIEEKYEEFLGDKLDLIFDFEPSPDEPTYSLDLKKRYGHTGNGELLQEVIDYDWGPHGD